MTIIDCIGDLHGHYPELDGGDLLIVAGDLTARDTRDENIDFLIWLGSQPYRLCIYIAGNHDNWLEKYYLPPHLGVEYLCNSGTEFEGLKIWGTPHSLLFDGVNPKCTAFMGAEEELKEKYDLIPDDIDILISHTPPFDTLDHVERYDGEKMECAGSKELLKAVLRIKPKYLICGHLHEHGGKEFDLLGTKVLNVSHVNEYYKPFHKPMRIII